MDIGLHKQCMQCEKPSDSKFVKFTLLTNDLKVAKLLME